MKEALEALVEANVAIQKALGALGSAIHDQAKELKALDDRVKILEKELTSDDNITLDMDTGDSQR